MAISWCLSATVTYKDGSWKPVEAVSDEAGFRMVAGTWADFVDVSYDPSFQQMLAIMGFPQTTGTPSPNVSDVIYRFHFMDTNGHINVIGSTKNVFVGNVNTPAEMASLQAAIQSDPNLVQVVQASVGPSQITLQPTDQSVLEGATATFSVTAISNAPMAYQWLKNGIAISGATSSTYVTPVTTVADDGSTYSIRITNSAGTTTSTSATLTVTPSGPPRIILTLSGLGPGQTFCGLGNGIHTVSPTTYINPPEMWWLESTSPVTPTYPCYFTINAMTGTTSVGFGLPHGFGPSPTTWFHAAFYATTFSIRSGGVSTYSFSFTAGPVTTKIKNRAFGTITTNGGFTISWQRASNWPSNP